MYSKKEELPRLVRNGSWPIDEKDLINGHSATYGWAWVQIDNGDMVLRSKYNEDDITKSDWSKGIKASSDPLASCYASRINRPEVIRVMSRSMDSWPVDKNKKPSFSMHGWGWIWTGKEMVFRSRGDDPDIKKEDWFNAKSKLKLVARSGGHFYE